MTPERFLIIKTTTDQEFAQRACQALEGAEIPVLLQHVTIDELEVPVSAFRILVPSTKTQNALKVLSHGQQTDSAQAA